MGSPPPAGTSSGAIMDKKYVLNVPVDVKIQDLFDAYVEDLETLRGRYEKKGLKFNFQRAGWSKRIASVRRHPKPVKKRKRKRP